MNYLAHSYLSCSNADILLGNFIADSVHKSEEHRYSQDVMKGITLHRKIDAFTDSHPDVRTATKMLRPNHGKYAPVVTDILWDHVLSNHWSRYSGEELRDFIDGVYKILMDNYAALPKKLLGKIDQMIAGDFLNRYQSLEGVRASFGFMDRRTKFPSNFVQAVDDYLASKEEFDELFNRFFPDLIEFSEGVCAC